jgi:hypothetical protein
MDLEARTKLLELLDTSTHSSMQALDAAALSRAKVMLRQSEDNVRTAHELLLFKLKKDNSQVGLPSLSFLQVVVQLTLEPA